MKNQRDMERELLEMQCHLARLKVRAERRRFAQIQKQSSENPSLFNELMDSTASALSSSRHNPFWQLALLPARGRYRVLMSILLIGAQFFNRRQSGFKK